MLKIIVDRILEEKARLNLSFKTMADMSELHINKETIRRILSGDTVAPGIDVILDIANTVGLKPYELFMDSKLAAEFKVFIELSSKSDETEAERIRIIAENDNLKQTNLGLADRIRVLEKDNDRLEEVITLKDEIIADKKEIIETYRKFIR